VIPDLSRRPPRDPLKIAEALKRAGFEDYDIRREARAASERDGAETPKAGSVG